MEWLEVHIDTNHAGLEPLEIFLSANGVDGVVIDDEQDFQSFLSRPSSLAWINSRIVSMLSCFASSMNPHVLMTAISP